MKTIARLLCGATFIGCLVQATGARASDPEVEARFKRGVTYYNEADFRAAAIEFRRAYEKGRNFKILYNLAQSEYQLTDYVAALRTFERYLKEGGNAIPVARHDEVEVELTNIRSRIASVTVTVNVAGAAITVDDQSIDSRPRGEPFLLNPGQHRIVARMDGWTDASRTVELGAGEAQAIDLQLRAPVAREPEAHSTMLSREGSWAPAIAAWSATGVLAASAVGLGLVASSKSDELWTVIADVFAFTPDVIAIIGTSEATTQLLVPIEKGWEASGPGGPRPQYVVSDGLKAAALTTAITNDEAEGGTELRQRVIGTAPGRPTTTTSAFLLRYEPKYGSSNSTAFGTAGAYDAAYVIMYGLAAASDASPSGRSIADGIAKLVGGTTKIDVGPDGINDVFQKLSAGVAIDLNGASSPLNFDLTTGESPADIEVWCVPSTIKAPTFRTTDLYFNAFTQKMTGKFRCD